MTKSRETVQALKERVVKVRENFEANPLFKWLPTFKNENPDLDFHQVHNVYYLKSTDEVITEKLEAFFEKYKELIEKGGGNG